MELVMKLRDMFTRTLARAVFLLDGQEFLLMLIMPRLYNIMLTPNLDQNHLSEATLAGVFLFLAVMIDRLQRCVGELYVRRKELSMADKRIKLLELERKKVNDADDDTIAQSKQLLDENQVLKNQLGLLRARLDDLDIELGTREKEMFTLCKRIKEQESELGTKMNEKTTLCRKLKQLESQLESKTEDIIILGTRVKQLESELETKAHETDVLDARLVIVRQQLEFERERRTTVHQENQLKGHLAEFDHLLNGNETLKNQLRSLPWRL